MQFGVRALWVLSLGFLSGVLIRSLFLIPESFSIFLIILAVATPFISFSVRSSSMRAFLPLCIFAVALGMVRMNHAVLRGNPLLNAKLGTQVEFLGVIADEPDIRDTSVRVPIRIRTFASSTESIAQTALVILPAYTEVAYGDVVRVRGVLEVPKVFDSGTGRTFNYPGYLAAQGIGYELDRAELITKDGYAGNVVVASAYRIKKAIVMGLERSLSEPHAGLAAGITVGEKRGLGKEISLEFRTVSLVHILVLSGYNITIVITYLFYVLGYFRTSRLMRFGIGAFVALFFAVMTGFASASLRASLMTLIAISGQLSNRVYKPERALAFVALGMVAWNPYLLVFDPGFGLSFLATVGLMLFSPLFQRIFWRVPKSLAIQETLVATSSAQLAVLPLLLYESGNLSLIGLFANIVVLPVLPLAMALSLVAAIAGIIAPAVSPLLGLPAYVLLGYVLSVAHLLSLVPFASVMLPAFSGWILVPVYGALLVLSVAALKDTTPKEGVV